MLTQESRTHKRVARVHVFTQRQLIRPNHSRGAWSKNQFCTLSNSLTGLAKGGLVFVLSPWIFWCAAGPGSPGNQKQVFAALLGNVPRIQNSDFGKLPTVAPRLQQIEALTRNLQRRSIGRKMPSNYLYELALDARALEIVADAVSGKYAELVRPPSGGPERARKNAPGLVSEGVQLTIPPPVITSSPALDLFAIFFLTPASSQRGAVPAGTKPHVFAGAVLGADQKARLTQMLDDVSSDLSDKVSFAGKNPSDPFTSVKIKITTRNRLKTEVSGYEVWFSPKVLFEENHQHSRFDRPSSPTDYPLPAGNYVFWTRSGSAQGPAKYCSDVGVDGLTERSVDPLFTP